MLLLNWWYEVQSIPIVAEIQAFIFYEYSEATLQLGVFTTLLLRRYKAGTWFFRSTQHFPTSKISTLKWRAWLNKSFVIKCTRTLQASLKDILSFLAYVPCNKTHFIISGMANENLADSKLKTLTKLTVGCFLENNSWTSFKIFQNHPLSLFSA